MTRRRLKPKNSLLLGVYLAIATALAAENMASNFYTCLPGMDSPGVSLPRGDIFKEVGTDPFPLYCHMNPESHFFKEGLRSDRLGFYVEGTYEKRQLEVEVLNETTIMAMYNPNKVTKDNIECSMWIRNETDLRGVCRQSVFVGFRPQAPEGFSCVSYNWQNLNCTWTEPFNPVKTKYELSYIVKGSYGSQMQARTRCPPSNKTRTPNCFLSYKGDPIFRQAKPFYYFTMNVTNPIVPKGIPVNLPINVHAVVKPNPPLVTAIADEPYSLLILSRIDHNLNYFPPGLLQLIQYKSDFDEDWVTLNLTSINMESAEVVEANYTLRDLVPYAEYTIKISLISALADQSDTRYWSDPTVVIARAKSIAPQLPPETNIGSFEVVANGHHNRSVYVYWKQIERTKQNGPNFRYRITEVNEDGAIRPLVPRNSTPSYSLFSNLNNRRYTFYVTSENSEGTAPYTSRVFVPSQSEMRDIHPTSITKIAFTDRFFEVSWLPPRRVRSVNNYTVYWCKSENNRDRPYQCDGQLDWLDVENGTQSVNITLPTENIYQFAVAANTKYFSSGMVWATCTLLHNKVVSKLRTVSIGDVGPRSLKVSWHLDCSDRVGKVSSYIISYCPIMSLDQPERCRNDEEPTKVRAPNDSEHHMLVNLDPWTYYMVGVSVETAAGEGPMSEYLVNRTKSDRPESQPEDLEAELISSTTVRLAWLPPAKPNGPIYFYEISYEYRDYRNEYHQKLANSTDLENIISDLQVYTKYTFKVRACNEEPQQVLCSQYWKAISITTGIGESGMMPPPLVTFVNSTEVKIDWNSTSFNRGGPLIRYEIRIAYQHTGNVHIFSPDLNSGDGIILNLNRISAQQDWSPDCVNASSVTNLYNFSIRAITIDEELTQKFASPWSLNEVVPAYCSDEYPVTLILCLSTIIPVCMVVATIYFFRCCNWSNRTSDLFKDVTKEMVNHTKPNNRSTLGDGQTTSDQDDPSKNYEMQEKSSPSTKKPNYQRAGSKDSMETLLTTNPKRNISGNSDTTSGCESGGPSCEDSDEAEEAERPIIDGSHRNSSSSLDKDEDPETPKALDHNCLGPAPSPPPLKQHHNYVKGFPVQTVAVKIPGTAPVVNFENNLSNNYGYYPGAMVNVNPAQWITTSAASPSQYRPPPNPSNGYVSFASVRDMSRNLPPAVQESEPPSPTSDSSGSPPLTPTPFSCQATTFNAALTPSDELYQIGIVPHQPNFDVEAVRLGSGTKQTGILPLTRGKVCPMPNDEGGQVTKCPPTNHHHPQPSSEFVIFPRELHVESRSPHNRIVTTCDNSFADRRYTMV